MKKKKIYKSPEIHIESLDCSTWACKVKPWERKINGGYLDFNDISNIFVGLSGNQIGGGFGVIVGGKKAIMLC